MTLHRWTSIGAALVAMSLGCGAAIAQETSRITAVTLYPGSATVERTARVVPGMMRLGGGRQPGDFEPHHARHDPRGALDRRAARVKRHGGDAGCFLRNCGAAAERHCDQRGSDTYPSMKHHCLTPFIRRHAVSVSVNALVVPMGLKRSWVRLRGATTRLLY